MLASSSECGGQRYKRRLRPRAPRRKVPPCASQRATSAGCASLSVSSLLRREVDIPLTDAQKAELDRRLKDLDRDPDAGESPGR